jgi:uncharacterized protein (TIGR02246 family)
MLPEQTMTPPGPPGAALTHWIEAFNAGDSQRVAALYAPDAVLWATTAAGRIDTPEGVHGYFARVLARTPAPRMQLISDHLREFGALAVHSGRYDLHLGPHSVAPARFTFVLRLADRSWQVVEHHSSLVPATA